MMVNLHPRWGKELRGPGLVLNLCPLLCLAEHPSLSSNLLSQMETLACVTLPPFTAQLPCSLCRAPPRLSLIIELPFQSQWTWGCGLDSTGFAAGKAGIQAPLSLLLAYAWSHTVTSYTWTLSRAAPEVMGTCTAQHAVLLWSMSLVGNPAARFCLPRVLHE